MVITKKITYRIYTKGNEVNPSLSLQNINETQRKEGIEKRRVSGWRGIVREGNVHKGT